MFLSAYWLHILSFISAYWSHIVSFDERKKFVCLFVWRGMGDKKLVFSLKSFLIVSAERVSSGILGLFTAW